MLLKPDVGDAELITAVRGGDVAAYGLLFERHVEAARRLARQLTSSSDADDLVSDAFTKVLRVLQNGGGPDLAFRAYLLTAVRRLHVDKIRAGAKVQTTDEMEKFDPGVPFRDTAVEGFENSAAAAAFASLPERWQLVLWHTEVEGQKPADVAELLGMSANSVSALAYRAREGLRQAFLNSHINEIEDDGCRWTHDHLGSYVRNGVSKRDAHKVEEHLDGCRKCMAIYLELTEVNSNLSGILAPVVLGAAATGYLASGTAAVKAGFLLTAFGRVRDLATANVPITAAVGVAAVSTVVGVSVALTQLSDKDVATDLSSRPGVSSTADPGATDPDGTDPNGTDPNAPDGTDPNAPLDTTTAPITDPATDPATDATTDPTTDPSADATDGTDPDGTDPDGNGDGTGDGNGDGPGTDPGGNGPGDGGPNRSPRVGNDDVDFGDVAAGSTSVPIDVVSRAGIVDEDGDVLTVTRATLAPTEAGRVVRGISVSARGTSAPARAGAGWVTYLPARGFSGAVTISYDVSDGNDSTVSGSIRLRVTAAPPVNQAPVAGDESLTTREDTILESVDLRTLVSDDDGDPLTVIVTDQPTDGAVTCSAAGVCTYDPDANFNGTDLFTYTASDGNGGTDTGTVTVIVTPVNDAPTAANTSTSTDEDAVAQVDLRSLIRDVDNDEVTVSETTAGTNGNASCSRVGLCTYTPDADFNGTDFFTYTVSDGNDSTATGTVTVTVDPVNDAPTATDDTLTTREDTTLDGVDLRTLVSDVDDDPLSVTTTRGPAHGFLACTGGDCAYTPDENYSGPDSFTYTVDDGNGGTATGTVAVTVSPVNDAPTAGDDELTTDEDTPAQVDLRSLVDDVDGDVLTISGTSDGAQGTTTCTSAGLCSYTPAPDFHADDSFTYTVDDGNGGTATATVRVTVSPVNDAPTAGDDELTTDEDTPDEVRVLGNDADLDGDELTVTDATDGAHGTVTCSPAGLCSYRPEPDFHGDDSFTYTVSDGNGRTATATVRVTVTAVNDAPTATADAADTGAGQPVTVDVLANDTDPDGDPLTLDSVGRPAHGTAEVVDGKAVYTPERGWAGPDDVTYTVSDGTDTATGTLTVTTSTAPPVNRAPEPRPDVAKTDAGTPVSVDVLANDTDPDGDELTLDSVGKPAHGTVEVVDGRVVYTPAAGWAGDDTVDYTVSDGSDTATGTLTVTTQKPVNRPPATKPDAATTPYGAKVSVDVLANDTDSDDDKLSLVQVAGAAHGTASVEDGRVVYVPGAGWAGDDTLTYTVSDGTDTATGTLVVTTEKRSNQPPRTTDDKAETERGKPVTVDVLANDTDPDGDKLTLVSVSGAQHGTAAVANGKVTYTPASGWVGLDTLTYTVDDGHGGVATGTLAVTTKAPRADLTISAVSIEGSGLFKKVTITTSGYPSSGGNATLEISATGGWNELLLAYLVSGCQRDGAKQVCAVSKADPSVVMWVLDIPNGRLDFTVKALDFEDTFLGNNTRPWSPGERD